MKNSIFGKKELEYLQDRKTFEMNNSISTVYKIRFLIRKRINNFINNDLNLLLRFENDNKGSRKVFKIKGKRIFTHNLFKRIVLNIISHFPYLISSIEKNPFVKYYKEKKELI
jgi:hypothetical protein